MSANYNMVNDFGESIAAFVAMMKTRQIAQTKTLTKTANPHKKECCHKLSPILIKSVRVGGREPILEFVAAPFVFLLVVLSSLSAPFSLTCFS